MSIKPEKLKQYISLKETAIYMRGHAAVECSDPKPDSRNATVSLTMRSPLSITGKLHTAFSALYTFSDAVYVATSRVKPDIIRFTFAVENMQRKES